MSFDPVSDLVVSDGQPVVSSVKIAERFGKQHRNVLQSIGNLCADLPEDYCLLNFQQTIIERPHPKGEGVLSSPAYNLTRDGFSLLVMGFTGKEALAWKIRFLEAFNAMERALLESANVRQPDMATLSSVHDRTPLVNLAKVWARLANIQYQDAFTQIAARYSLPTITILPRDWVQDAIDWVQAQIDGVQAHRLAGAAIRGQLPEAVDHAETASAAKARAMMDMALDVDAAAKGKAKEHKPVTHPGILHVAGFVVAVVRVLSRNGATDETLYEAVSDIIQNGLPVMTSSVGTQAA